ncbi:telomeric repeat-binding factor 2-interacting protein 1 isoform X2 [Latimeria chalumnae]|nr:PREDICTED: telomeric repeat-binding factor 2-interacting protein 1 isoform X2 [Latimeria chalumnae]|eukprot:XP_006003445.1 PREDICTED: telomeric repeat-binding factor 2-interacting protein 1 isoform X2 [Latimeria chalumnae]
MACVEKKGVVTSFLRPNALRFLCVFRIGTSPAVWTVGKYQFLQVFILNSSALQNSRQVRSDGMAYNTRQQATVGKKTAESCTHSRTLFVREDGAPVWFYLRPGPAKKSLAPLIRHGGGGLCRVQESGAVLLADTEESEGGWSPEHISVRYITDCVSRNERLDLEAYRVGAAVAPRKLGGYATGACCQHELKNLGGRVAYTRAEDVAILMYLRDHKAGQTSVKGNAVWMEMERISLTRHSWQSMKDRYMKKLRGQEDKYQISARSVIPTLVFPSCSQCSKKKNRRNEREDPVEGREKGNAAQTAESESPRQTAGEKKAVKPLESKVVEQTPEEVPNCLVEQSQEMELPEAQSHQPIITMANFVLNDDSDIDETPSQLDEDFPTFTFPPATTEDAKYVLQSFMKEFSLDLLTVTQAFLKNNGDVEATWNFLKTGSRPDGFPIWTRKDDLDLQSRDQIAREELIRKFGAANIALRIAFQGS